MCTDSQTPTHDAGLAPEAKSGATPEVDGSVSPHDTAWYAVEPVATTILNL